MNNLNKYLKLFSYVVILLLIALGLFMLFSDFFYYMPKNYRIIFALIIIAYGSFRLVTIINKPKSQMNEDK
jgi:hypothetical protein